jgi:hypothetical protein
MNPHQFDFKKMLDYYFLFLVTAEDNIKKCEGQLTDCTHYEDLYNDIVYDVPYHLFLRKLKKEISKVELLTDEHEQKILKEYKELLDIMPPKTKNKIEKIIRYPFEYKRMKQLKKKNMLLIEDQMKTYFKN